MFSGNAAAMARITANFTTMELHMVYKHTSHDLYNREKDQKKIPQQQNCCCAYLDRNTEAEKATNETQNQTDVCSKENMNSICTRRFCGDG